MHVLQRSLMTVLILAGSVSGLTADDATSAAREQELLAVLKSDAPAAEKAVTCKKLAIDGSSAAVPELEKLLPDPQLSSWARIAIEAIPGDESNAALRTAASSLRGELLIGMLNSIGVKRDVQAIELLTQRLQDDDSAVAAAAAVALGHIGNADSTAALLAALDGASDDVRSAVAQGCVLCAERFHADGDHANAVDIYDKVRQADVPTQRRLEATRGAILAREEEDGIALLKEQFQSPDRIFFRLALSTAREFPGSEIDEVLADEVASSSPDRGALIIQAMSDRPDTVILSAVLDAAEDGPKPVRLSAIEALSRVGDESCLPALLTIATDDDVDLAQTAGDTLAALPGDGIDEKIVARLPKAEGKMYPLLLELVGRRRIDALSELLRALDNSDATVRHAALAALGETVPLDQLSVLIDQVIRPNNADDKSLAETALKTASVRMPDRKACAEKLAEAVTRAPAGTKTTILEILSDVGGTRALQAMADASKSGDEELLDTSSRLLGKWNSVEAAPVLMDLAKTASDRKYQIRGMRGYLGLARKFTSGKERADMCQQALDAATRAEEKHLALEVLELRPSAETLAVAMKAMDTPALKDKAQQTTLSMVQKLAEQGVNLQELLPRLGLKKVKLEIVKAEYGAGDSMTDVTDKLRQRANDLPLITLASGSYNDTFGRDPAPGTPKLLKVSYRINGQPAEASFAEDALILLPLP